MDLKAKLAGLKAEFEAMRRTKEAKLAVTLLKKEQEILKAEAMEKVYADAELLMEEQSKAERQVLVSVHEMGVVHSQHEIDEELHKNDKIAQNCMITIFN